LTVIPGIITDMDGKIIKVENWGSGGWLIPLKRGERAFM